MSDLAIVKGCAKALGKELHEVQGLIGTYYETADGPFWPLTTKQQALDIAVALRMKIVPQDLVMDNKGNKVPGWRVETEGSVAPHYNVDLLRAICECAAELNGVRI